MEPGLLELEGGVEPALWAEEEWGLVILLLCWDCSSPVELGPLILELKVGMELALLVFMVEVPRG